MGKETAYTAFSICFGIILIISVALFGSSFALIELQKAALFRNKYSVQLESGKIYLNGRYFTGIAGEFLEYPTTWQQIHFSSESGSDEPVVSVKSNEGTQVRLELSLIYRLKYEFLHDLYAKYKKNYHQVMVKSAKDQIVKVITTYKAEELFTKRQQIANEISQKVNSKFKADFDAELTLLLMREVILETRLEDTTVQTQVKKQEVKTEEYKNRIQELEGEIQVIASSADIIISKNYAEASQQAEELKSTKQAQGDALTRKAEGNGLQIFRSSVDVGGLGFTEEQLIRFIFIEKLINMQGVDLMLDLPETSIYNI